MKSDPNDKASFDETRRSLLLTSATVGLTGLISSSATAETERKETRSGPTPNEQVSPTEFISTISTDTVNEAVSSVSYQGENKQLARFDSSVQDFPLDESEEFGVMSSGIANSVPGEPSDFISTDIDGISEPDFSPDGFNAYNIATLDIDITIPTDASILAFDYKFGTEENPSFLDSDFQDFFEAFLITPAGEVEPLATLPDGSAVTVSNADQFSNSPTGTSDNPEPPLPEPADTSFNSVTDLQTASYDVSAIEGETATLRLRIADASDAVFDSGVFVDNLRFTGNVDVPDGYLEVQSALDSYEDAAVRAIEAEVRAQAKIEASFYENHGDDYAATSRDFWGYKAGILDADEIDSDIRKSTDSLLKDLDTEVFDNDAISLEDNAEMIYNFKSELFDALASSSDKEATAYQYYRGTADQANYVYINNQTVDEYINSFLDEFATVREDILSELQNTEPPQSRVEQYATDLQNAAAELEDYATTTESDAADLIDAIEDSDGDEVEIDIIGGELQPPETTGTSEADPFGESDTVDPQFAITGAIGGAALLKGAASAGLGLLKSYGVFKIGAGAGGILAAGAAVQVWAAGVKSALITTANIIKKIGKEVLKEWAKEEVKEIFKRNIMYPDSIDGGINAASTPDITKADVSKEDPLPNWWNSLVSLVDAVFGTSWSKVSHGIETGQVTITNLGEKELYPVFRSTLQGLTPDGQYVEVDRPIVWKEPYPWADRPAPGQTKTYEFTYRVPISAYIQGRLSLSLKDAYKADTLAETTAYFNIGNTEDSATSSELFSGSVTEGASEETTYTPGAETETFTCDLTYDSNYLDLHLYDENNNHTGWNYDTGEMDTEIPNSAYSGRDTGETGFEWVSVSDVDSETFTVETVAPTVTTLGSDETAVTTAVSPTSDSSSISISGSVGTTEFEPLPPAVSFSRTNLTRGVEAGQTAAATITLSETNGDTDAGSVTVTASDLTAGTASIPGDQLTIDPSTVELAAGDSQSLTLEIDVPADVEPLTYETTLTVESDTEAVDTETQLTVQIAVDPTVPGSPTEYYADTPGGEVDDTDVANAVQDWSNGEGWFGQTETPDTDIAKLVQSWAQ